MSATQTLPDQKGRVFIVTGANTGIGRITAEALGAAGARVYVGCRSKEKGEPVKAAIEKSGGSAEILELDLGDLSSVRDAARRFLATKEPLHGLINNAGLAGQHGLTKDGFEITFGTNHLGHFLLTTLLLDRLRESPPARIVNVSSKAHYDAKGIDYEALRKPTVTLIALPEYSVSKLANVLFTRELARRLEGTEVTSYALHPGVVASDVWRKIPWPVRPLIKAFMLSPEDGAKTTLHCATSPDLAAVSGRYYDSCKERKPSALALDDALARTLWEKSEAWTAAFH